MYNFSTSENNRMVFYFQGGVGWWGYRERVHWEQMGYLLSFVAGCQNIDQKLTFFLHVT